MLKQRDIGMALLAIRKTMDIIDDGYHRREYAGLTKISNSLFTELNEVNQEKLKAYLRKQENEA